MNKATPNIVVINRNVKNDKKKMPTKKIIKPKTVAGARPSPEQKMRIYQNVVKPKLEKNVGVQGEDDIVQKMREAFGANVKLTPKQQVNKSFENAMQKVRTAGFKDDLGQQRFAEPAVPVARGRGRPAGSGGSARSAPVVSSAPPRREVLAPLPSVSSPSERVIPLPSVRNLMEQNLASFMRQEKELTDDERHAIQALTRMGDKSKQPTETPTPKGIAKQREDYSRMESDSGYNTSSYMEKYPNSTKFNYRNRESDDEEQPFPKTSYENPFSPYVDKQPKNVVPAPRSLQEDPLMQRFTHNEPLTDKEYRSVRKKLGEYYNELMLSEYEEGKIKRAEYEEAIAKHSKSKRKYIDKMVREHHREMTATETSAMSASDAPAARTRGNRN